MILPEADAALAQEVAERAGRAVSRMGKPGLPPVALSAGVAGTSDASDPDGLFAAADRALYAAKRRGRNRVERFSAEICGPLPEPAPQVPDPATRRRAESVADLACRLAAAAGWGTREISALRQSALVADVLGPEQASWVRSHTSASTGAATRTGSRGTRSRRAPV